MKEMSVNDEDKYRWRRWIEECW